MASQTLRHHFKDYSATTTTTLTSATTTTPFATSTAKTRRQKKMAMAKRALRSLAVALMVPLSLTMTMIFLFGSGHKYRALAKPFWFPNLWLIHLGSLGSSFLMGLSAWLVWAEGHRLQSSSVLSIHQLKMLDWCLGARRVRQLQKILRNGKLTIFCLFLTVIVLRGNLGAGKFGTPQQDFEEIRERFYYHKRAEPRRVLVEAQTTTTTAAESASDNNYATFDINKILVDEGEDEKPDPKKPYSLGPKISDWDEQRAEWLKRNPNFANFIGPNKPRVLLVTGSSPKPCENPVGDHYLLKSIKNKIDYCRVHGIEIFYNMALLDAEMAGFWAKLPLIRKLLLSHPEVEFLWWMDSDAMFTDMAFEVPWERYRDHNFVMHGWNEMVYDQKNWIGLNTGSFLLRNCQWSLDILDAWAPMGPKGKIREEAGKILTRELKDRPVFEADDQSAMVYILETQRDKWGDKVYLESAYYLHGYWGILVDRYEEMMENFHPGLGDHRWPLVTHFVGCKPCGKFGDYPVERCLKQMDRAFNFGDNQILQMYGFTHKSLASRRVKRSRNETSNPLEVKDELGLLHPAFKSVEVSSS
ncbi:hypothetical protein F0562_000627 [Nyssa sinensis]|uniref:xyloglucan 6-xylosyltransferase n=1 Tax=Nyssa sinensis TaxID=561372 RepID=A0A5J5C0M3_9ASTE|nr:hypothetical protein F0562_000627 [Nyssa sinensis]